jgi:sugar lactone lactonase YvrE
VPQFVLTLFASVVVAGAAWGHPGPGIVVDSRGQVYFVHGIRHRIMKVDAAGRLTTFVQGEEGKKLSNPHHLVLDREDALYSVGDRDGVIWKITPDGKTTQVYPPTDWYGIRFLGSGGDPFTIDARGNIYGINTRQFKHTQILKISPDGRIAALAGGDYGTADGKRADAKLGGLHGSCFAWGPDGSLYLTDSGQYIRKITPEGTVTTLVDSSGRKELFKGAQGLACDAKGNLYVGDAGNLRVRKLTPDSKLVTLAGSGEFKQPVGVAVSGDGSVYVLDYTRDDPCVRKISADGVVTTIAVTEKTR